MLRACLWVLCLVFVPAVIAQTYSGNPESGSSIINDATPVSLAVLFGSVVTTVALMTQWGKLLARMTRIEEGINNLSCIKDKSCPAKKE